MTQNLYYSVHFCAPPWSPPAPPASGHAALRPWGSTHAAGRGRGGLIGVPQGADRGMGGKGEAMHVLHVARLTMPDIALGQYPRRHVSCHL